MHVIDRTNQELGYNSNPYNNTTPRRERPSTMTSKTPTDGLSRSDISMTAKSRNDGNSKSDISMVTDGKSWERHCTNYRADLHQVSSPKDFLKPARHECCCHTRRIDLNRSQRDIVTEYSRNVSRSRSASNCSINTKR